MAGVGSVAYKGYIKKANEAADLELLGAVNTAFQSACTEVGQNPYPAVAAVGLQGDIGNKTVDFKKVTYGDNIPLKEFEKYFKGNENAAFKTYEELGYEGNGVFFGIASDGTIKLSNGMKLSSKDNGNGTRTYTVEDSEGNKMEYTIKNEDMEQYLASTFGTNMTASGLMSEVDNVAKTFANFLDGPFSSFASRFVEATGYEIDPDDPDYYKKIGNALVMGVAEKTTSGSFDAKAIADKWVNDKKYSVSLNTSDLNDTAAQLALAYSMATGFANSEIGKTQQFNFGGKTMTAAEYYKEQTESWSGLKGMDALQGVQTMLGAMIESEGYQQYYEQSGQQDIDGYLSALGVLNENKDTFVNKNGVVDNAAGFSDEDIGAILDGLFGSN